MTIGETVMRKCQNCGAPGRDNGIICEYCGIEYDQASSDNASVICPQCKFRNQKDSDYCNNCGIKLYTLCYKCKGKIPVIAKRCIKCGSIQAELDEVSLDNIYKKALIQFKNKKYEESERLLMKFPINEHNPDSLLLLLLSKNNLLPDLSYDIRFKDSYEKKRSDILEIISYITKNHSSSYAAQEALKLKTNLSGKKVGKDYSIPFFLFISGLILAFLVYYIIFYS